MILDALVGLYERLAEREEVAAEGWCKAKVSYAVNLSEEGRITGIIPMKTEADRGKKKVWVPVSLMVPEMVTRSSGVAANFLCDNSKYILGIDAEGTSPRVLECFQASRERHLKLLNGIGGRMAHAICLFFENWDPEEAEKDPVIKERWQEITDGGNLIFAMGMGYAQEDPWIREAWEKGLERMGTGTQGVCLVTGERTEIARIHRGIKGVPGAQSSGAALVSFNAPSFESYGKEQSYNAPVGKYAEFAYTTALNYLLDQREYALRLGDSMIVFWAESGEEEYQDFFFMSADPKADNQEVLKDIFTKLKRGQSMDLNGVQLDLEQRFYILGLSPNAARLSVRFFYENSFGNILTRLAEHYERMEVIRPSWEKREYLGIRDMLDQTVNPNAKDRTPVPGMASLVLQAVLSGGRYPAGLYENVLIRIRAEQGNVTWGRAEIIKAYLIQNYHWKEGGNFMALNTESCDTAYVLGRLFAVLESIQMDTTPGIRSTIRDRYFNSASTAPASVFPILNRLKNSHLKKLEREKGSSKIYYERLLTELMGKLEHFPLRLSLEEQGEFALGYYHQMQKRYEKREEK